MSLIHDLLNGKHNLSEQMMKYIATPAPCYCHETDNCNCYQSHGGDLFQHSQWSALYLTMWLKTEYINKDENYLHTLLTEIVNSDLLKTVISNDDEKKRKEFIQLCGFMHDIGKGGDDKTDMYEKNKYIGYDEKFVDDSYHPEVCKLVIITPPENLYNSIFKKVLEEEVLTQYTCPIKARFILALVAAVHWNFGKLNVQNINYTVSNYISDFNAQIEDIKSKLYLKDFPELFSNNTAIKLCMIVSCSDIASGNNKELIGEVNSETNNCNSIENSPPIQIDNITVSKCTHLSNGSKWIGMKKKYKDYISSILKELENPNQSQGGLKKILKKKRKHEKTLKKLRKKHKKTSKKTLKKLRKCI